MEPWQTHLPDMLQMLATLKHKSQEGLLPNYSISSIGRVFLGIKGFALASALCFNKN